MIKTTVNYGKCSIFVLGMDMNCPLCKTLVLSGESHQCEQHEPKKLPKKRKTIDAMERRA